LAKAKNEFQNTSAAALEQMEAEIKQNRDVARTAIEQETIAMRARIEDMEKELNTQLGVAKEEHQRKIDLLKQQLNSNLKRIAEERRKKSDDAKKSLNPPNPK
jgi:hypothetical protein